MVERGCWNKIMHLQRTLQKDNSTVTHPKMMDKFTQTEKKQNGEFKIESRAKPSKTCGRRNATTTLLPEPVKLSLKKGRNKTSPLFKNDLIDIIAEKNDKRLQVLFTNPNNEDHSSIMNLMPSPKTIRKAHLHMKPWR